MPKGHREEGQYNVPATCVICGKQFLAYYAMARKAKVCTRKDHICRIDRVTLPSGREATKRCREDCCRSQYVRGAGKQFLSGTLERTKYFEGQEELDRVLAKIPDIPPDPGMAIRLIAAGGLRVSEVLAIRVSDLALDASIPHFMVPTAKRLGRPKRRIDLSPAFAKELARYVRSLRKGEHDPIFTFTKRTVQRWWYLLQEKAGMTLRRSIHSLRHTHFTRLAEMGVDPVYSQKRAGWTSLEMYKVYAHISDKMRQDVASRLPKV